MVCTHRRMVCTHRRWCAPIDVWCAPIDVWRAPINIHTYLHYQKSDSQNMKNAHQCPAARAAALSKASMCTPPHMSTHRMNTRTIPTHNTGQEVLTQAHTYNMWSTPSHYHHTIQKCSIHQIGYHVCSSDKHAAHTDKAEMQS